MRNGRSALVFFLLCLASTSSALELEKPVPIEIGGRFTYGMHIQRDAIEFPWNLSTNSFDDPTRLMFDLSVGKGRMGLLYLKGAALWKADDEESGGKRFHFEQGDYFREEGGARARVRLRLYANERRLFTHSLIASLLDDDRMEGDGENLGARADGAFLGRFGVTALYSALGSETDRSEKIAYMRADYSHNHFGLAAAYAHRSGPEENLPDRAVLQTELSAYYKRASLLVSYEQSGRGDGLFFPSARFHLDAFEADNFHGVLPDEGAFFAEARLASLPVQQLGALSLVYRYSAVKRSFEGMFGGEPGSAGYSTGAYFLANDVSLNGRLVYNRRVRFGWENETDENVEASVWAQLKNSSEAFLRGRVGETTGPLSLEDRDNFIHGAWIYQKDKLRTGAHFMLKDLDTIFSERRYAWDCKLSFSGDMAVYWRALIAHNDSPSDALYARFEYRPNPRLFLTVGYGRHIFGDDPFLLEDADIATLREVTPRYTFSIRGDF